MNGGTINFDPDRLAQLKFNPLLCESHKNFSVCKDNDSDIIFFFLENGSCEYYTEDSFNNMLANERSRLNLNCSSLESDLSFPHMNILSISNKCDRLTNFLCQLRVKFPIVGISESRLDNCHHFSDIAGYNFLHKPRVTRVGGGVALHNLTAFKVDLGKINCAEILGLDDPFCAYKFFIEKYVATDDGCFQLERKKRNDSIFVSLGLLKVLLNP